MSGLATALLLLVFASFGPGSDAARIKRQTDPDCMCIDYYGGCRATDTQWVDDDVWIYSCTKKGIVEVGCQATERGERKVIPMGQKITVNGFWYTCDRMRQKLKYAQEHSCDIGGNLYHVGDTVNDGHFIWQCFDYGIGTSGCLFTDKTEGQIKLKIDETRTIGCYNHTCKVASRNPWTIRYVAKPLEECETVTGADDLNQKKANAALIDEKQTLKFAKQPIPSAIYSASFVRSDNSFDVKVRYLT